MAYEGEVHTWREYRPAGEVFDSASIDSLRGAPVVEGHPNVITAENWNTYARGHVADDVTRDIPSDGPVEYVSATLRIADMRTQAKLGGELVEISCAYECDIDPTPGVAPDGTPYDVVQRNIRYNHVGLGPMDWGRAGPEVRLFLDSAGSDHALAHYDARMSHYLRSVRADSLRHSPVPPHGAPTGGAPAPIAPAPAPVPPPIAPAPVAPRADGAAPAPLATAPNPLTHQIDVAALVAQNQRLANENAELAARVTSNEAALEALRASSAATAADEETEARAAELVSARADAAALGLEIAPRATTLEIHRAIVGKLSPTTAARLTADSNTSRDAWSSNARTALEAYRAHGGGNPRTDSRLDSAIASAAATRAGSECADVSPIERGRDRQDARFAAPARRFGEAREAPAPAASNAPAPPTTPRA